MRPPGVRTIAVVALWLCAAAATATGTSPDLQRDPFSLPPATVENGSTSSPLQRYRLEELRLVATAHAGGAPRALIEDPTGLGFVVRVGQVVGSEAATVTGIERGCVSMDTSGGSTAVVGNPLSTAARRSEGK